MSQSTCNCCEESSGGGECPSNEWLTLDRWVGSRTIPNNLKNIHLRPFQLEFTFSGITEMTPLLQPTATLSQIKAALESLTNLGTGMTVAAQGGLVTTGALPGDDVWIWFDTALTTGQDVPLLRVVYPNDFGVSAIEAWEISVVREGGLGVDEIQSLKRRAGVWEEMELDKYDNAVWQWRVIPFQSSKLVTDLKGICIQQNRRDWSTWITPFRDGLASTFFKLGLIGLKWFDSPLTATLISGSFSLSLKVGSNEQFLSAIPVGVTDISLQSGLQGLSNSAEAGTITVGGGMLPVSFAVTFTEPSLPVVLAEGVSSILASSPPVDVVTTREGNPTLLETEIQRLDYRWPATGGSFTITVTNPLGGPFTTAAIPYDADALTIQNALLMLPNLNTPPTLGISLTTADGWTQQIYVNDDATVTGGTFQLILTVNGATAITSPIPVTGTASDIRTALLTLPNMLPTDDVTVSATPGDLSTATISFGGTLTSPLPKPPIPSMVPVSALTGGDVRVSSTTTDSATYGTTKFTRHTNHTLTFTGALLNTNVPAVTTTSNLVCEPVIDVQQDFPNSQAKDFRNYFEALNLGTIWKHYLRTAYGHADNRRLRVDQLKHQTRLYHQDYEENNIVGGLNFGPYIEDAVPCGLGYRGQAIGSSINSCTPKSWVLVDFPVVNEMFPVLPIPHWEFEFENYRADFDKQTGTITVTSGASKEIELAFQIRCLGCGFSAEFNAWGTHEQSDNGYFSPYSDKEGDLYIPPEGYDTCPPIVQRNSPPIYFCRFWKWREDNVPHLFRKRWGPDGFDACFINDKFYVEGEGTAFRKPPCNPDVVLMGDGYWLEQRRSRVYPAIAQKYDHNGNPVGCAQSCPPRPIRESQVEHPVSDIDRLRLLLGNNFSYWGGWIDLEHSVQTGNKIKCKFDQFDLSGINTLILGGLPVKPQYDPSIHPFLPFDSTGNTNRMSENWRDSLGMKPWDIDPSLIRGREAGNGGFIDGVVHKEFEDNTLDTLKNWLDLPGKVLVLDGGVWPIKFLASIGLLTTVETFGGWNNPNVELPTANTLNGTLDKGFVSLPGPPPIVQSSNGGGFPVWGPDYNYPITNNPIPLVPLHVTPEPQLLAMDFVASTKYSLPSQNSIWYGDQLTKEYLVSPVSKLKSYTTAVPLVTPSPDATILARLKGDMLVPPFHDWTNYFSISVDYPAVVSEPWRTAYFKLRFTFAGSTYETATLSMASTALDIKNALEALPNIGTSITTAGGPVGSGSIHVWFDSLLTTGQDVPLLEVVSSSAVTVSLIREGGAGVDEIQKIEKTAEVSQVIISGICELVNPDAWGINYRDAADYVVGDKVGQIGDNVVCGGVTNTLTGSCVVICSDGPNAGRSVEYGVDGYAWGLGLTHIVNDQFLLDLTKG